MSQVDAILKGIRTSYQKTNMQDVRLDEVLQATPETKIGYLLQNMEPESTKEYSINFDPIQVLYLEKLVSQNVVEKRLIMESRDFFKGIVFVDYYTNIIANNCEVIDELYQLAQELERRDANLDPDLNMVIHHIGMHEFTRTVKNKGPIRGARQRYQRKNKHVAPHYVMLKKISPVYEALGAMVLEQIQNETIKGKLPDMEYLYDIKAAIFIDTVCNFLDDPDKEELIAKIAEGDYYDASLLAMVLTCKKAAEASLQEYGRKIKRGRR